MDRFFTLFFLVTSIVIVPTFNSLFAVVGSENTQEASLMRGFLWSSVIGSIMVVVAVYGLAILLNVQWLRFAGIYGLLCIFAKAWIMLVAWLSTSSAYWGIMANSTLNYGANFACIFVALLLYYAWQRRSKIRIKRLIYYAGIIASYDLFLIFSFLLKFILFNYDITGLILPFQAITLLVISGIAAVQVAHRKELELGRKTLYISITSFAISEIWASSILLSPIYLHILSQNPWTSLVLAIIFYSACATIIAMSILIILTRIKKRGIMAMHKAASLCY